MRHGTKRLILTALAAALASPLVAETILIETAPGGKGADLYAEPSGVWQTIEAHSEAAGLTAGLGSRALMAVDGKLEGTATFAPKVSTPGTYHVDITWPSVANAQNVQVNVSGLKGAKTSYVNFTPSSVLGNLSGRWVRLGDVELAAGDQLNVTVDPSTSTGVANTADEYELAVSALRVTSDLTDAVIPGAAANAASTGTEQAAAPFTNSDQKPEEAENPFSENETEPKSPFASTDSASQPIDDSIRPSATQQASPFEETAKSEATSPFAGAPTGESASPFQEGSTAPPQDSQDPFVKYPSDAEPSVFSGQTGSSVAASNPFDSDSSTPSSPFDSPEDSDPFAKENVVPPPPLEMPGSKEPASPFAATEQTSPIRAMEEAAAPPAEPKEDVVSLGFTIPTETKPEAPPAISIPEQPKEDTKYTDLKFYEAIPEATAAAMKDDKPVFMFITGPSRRAEDMEKLLSTEKVAAKLKNFELVKIDYTENRAMARQYAVRTFPYFVILNKYGYTLGHLTPSSDTDDILKDLSMYIQEY